MGGIVERHEARGRPVQRFEHAGLECATMPGAVIAVKHHGGTGYVRVPEPLRSSPPDSWAELEVHGGVTWPAGERGVDEGGWIGFDCAHAFSQGVDVKAETRQLAEQVAELNRKLTEARRAT